MRMGRINRDDVDEEFNVAVLALRQSPRRNAVSRLHRRVTARMMEPGWVDFPEGEMPIESVTNGVHTKTWVASEMEQLYDHYLGPRWREDTSSPEAWQRVERIPDLELWHAHSRLRERLVAYAREQAQLQARDRRRASGVGPPAHPPLRARRAHHRLRPALRHLQAGHAALQGRRPAQGASCSTRAGRCSC